MGDKYRLVRRHFPHSSSAARFRTEWSWLYPLAESARRVASLGSSFAFTPYRLTFNILPSRCSTLGRQCVAHEAGSMIFLIDLEANQVDSDRIHTCLRGLVSEGLWSLAI